MAAKMSVKGETNNDFLFIAGGPDTRGRSTPKNNNTSAHKQVPSPRGGF